MNINDSVTYHKAKAITKKKEKRYNNIIRAFLWCYLYNELHLNSFVFHKL